MASALEQAHPKAMMMCLGMWASRCLGLALGTTHVSTTVFLAADKQTDVATSDAAVAEARTRSWYSGKWRAHVGAWC